MNTGSNILEPVGLPPNVSPAPVDILNVVKCGPVPLHDVAVLLPACPALNSALVEAIMTAGMSIP